jgi:hypothetical protein
MLQMRGSQQVLDTILTDADAVAFLSSLLSVSQAQTQLAAMKLLAVLCTMDLAKDSAVHQQLDAF